MVRECQASRSRLLLGLADFCLAAVSTSDTAGRSYLPTSPPRSAGGRLPAAVHRSPATSNSPRSWPTGTCPRRSACYPARDGSCCPLHLPVHFDDLPIANPVAGMQFIVEDANGSAHRMMFHVVGEGQQYASGGELLLDDTLSDEARLPLAQLSTLLSRPSIFTLPSAPTVTVPREILPSVLTAMSAVKPGKFVRASASRPGPGEERSWPRDRRPVCHRHRGGRRQQCRQGNHGACGHGGNLRFSRKRRIASDVLNHK